MAWIFLLPFAIVIGLYLRSLQQQQARKKRIARVMRQHRATQLKRQHRLSSAPDRQLPRKPIPKSKFFHSPNASSARVNEIAKDLRQSYPDKSEAWIWDKSRQIVGKQRLASQSKITPIKRNPDEHLKQPYRKLVSVLGDKKVAQELVVSRIKRNRELSLEAAINEALGLVRH